MKVYENDLECPKYWVAKYKESEDVLIDTASKSLAQAQTMFFMQYEVEQDVEYILIQIQKVNLGE